MLVDMRFSALWFLTFLFLTIPFVRNEVEQRRFGDYVIEDQRQTGQHTERPLSSFQALGGTESTADCQKTQCPDSTNFEPIFSIGPFFLGRLTERSPFLPYTKNRTIAFLGGITFVLGFFIGYTLKDTRNKSEQKLKSKSAPDEVNTCALPPSVPATQDVDSTAAIAERLQKLNLDSSAECSSSAASTQKNDDQSPYDDQNLVSDESSSDKSEADDGDAPTAAQETEHSTAVQLTSDAIQRDSPRGKYIAAMDKLTAQIEQLRRPLQCIANASNDIYTDVGVLKRTMQWIAGRKAKGDAWLVARDSMYVGILVMNVTLALCCFLFGRWQDFGHQCEFTTFNWTIRSVLDILWCYVEEPVIFIVGCSLWLVLAKMTCTPSFLKRKNPASSALLVVIIVGSGLAHSFVVSFLGGSWPITMFVWVLYAMYLIHHLEEAKNGAESTANGDWTIFFVGAVVLPVLAGALPFWNYGLSIALSAMITKQAKHCSTLVLRCWEELYDFLLH